jgi:acetone carboxylase alpha subunit
VKNGLSGVRVAADVYGVVVNVNSEGVVTYDKDATEALRAEHRRQRLARGVPAAEYKRHERERLISGDVPETARAMYRDVMEVSPTWAAEFRSFWDLPEGFEVNE